MAARHGDTLCFAEEPVIASYAAVGGKKEGEGPLAAGFDELTADNRLGQASWEAAETQLLLRAAKLCLKKAHTTEKQVSLVLAGDLQAQCTASNYALRELGIPFAVLLGEDEIAQNRLSVKNFATGEQVTVSAEEAIALIRQELDARAGGTVIVEK